MAYRRGVGTKRFTGVWFRCYSHDHLPVHFHARYGKLTVIVELLGDGSARVSERKDAIRPRGGSRTAVRHILKVAMENYDALEAQWRQTHGEPDGR